MNAFNWTRFREMRVANTPRAAATEYAEAETVVPQRYPDTRDGRGRITPISVAVWLGEHGWRVGDSDDPQGPVAVARRLLFYRALHVSTFLDRGGQP